MFLFNPFDLLVLDKLETHSWPMAVYLASPPYLYRPFDLSQLRCDPSPGNPLDLGSVLSFIPQAEQSWRPPLVSVPFSLRPTPIPAPAEWGDWFTFVYPHWCLGGMPSSLSPVVPSAAPSLPNGLILRFLHRFHYFRFLSKAARKPFATVGDHSLNAFAASRGACPVSRQIILNGFAPLGLNHHLEGMDTEMQADVFEACLSDVPLSDRLLLYNHFLV